MELSRENRTLLKAHEKGYRIVDGVIMSSKGDGKTVKATLNKGRYFKFSTTEGRVKIHKLVAFQKFGNAMFEEGIMVRHLDGDGFNNLPDNIALGTCQDNADDVSDEVRKRRALKAGLASRKYTDEQMLEMRKMRSDGCKYAEIMEKFNVKDTGSMWKYLHRYYATFGLTKKDLEERNGF